MTITPLLTKERQIEVDDYKRRIDTTTLTPTASAYNDTIITRKVTGIKEVRAGTPALQVVRESPGCRDLLRRAITEYANIVHKYVSLKYQRQQELAEQALSNNTCACN